MGAKCYRLIYEKCNADLASEVGSILFRDEIGIQPDF